MNTNKITAIFLTLLMVASVGYAQFTSIVNRSTADSYVAGEGVNVDGAEER